MGLTKIGTGDERLPLVLHLPKDSDDSENQIKRTGTVWSAIAHIITGVLGSGVLAFAWSVAQLGWIGGPATILFFAAITLVQSSLIADCYRSPDSMHGHIRNRSYMDAVRLNLGETNQWICGVFQQVALYGIGVAYTITSSGSFSSGEKHASLCGFMQYLSLYGAAAAYVITISACVRAIHRSNCYHEEGRDARCPNGEAVFMLMFGVVQIFLSQIPGIRNMKWLSVVSAAMSFSYSFIGFGLGVAKVIGNGVIKGGIGGIPTPSTSQKLWRISQAIGDIAFAYPYSLILIEIEDTLKAPPPENQTMKKASMASVSIITFFYLCCGCFGYAAFGNDTPGNLLTGFGSYEPYWLVDFANACIILHLVGGYQLYSQPIFAFAERWFAGKYPSNGLMNGYFTINLRPLPPCRIKLIRLCFRTLYVISTTGFAMAFPYFNQFLALLGAFKFWPVAIYFPVRMYFVQKEIQPWTPKWIFLQAFSVVCLLLSLFAFVGSVQGVFNERLK